MKIMLAEEFSTFSENITSVNVIPLKTMAGSEIPSILIEKNSVKVQKYADKVILSRI